MSTYNAKNYTAQGGSVTVIGGELQVFGKLTIAPDAEVIGLTTPVIEEEVMAVGLAPIPSIPDSVATTVAQLRADYNALLANLRDAGILARDPE